MKSELELEKSQIRLLVEAQVLQKRPSLFGFNFYCNLLSPSKQGLSKTHQRASKRGSAEIVLSLTSQQPSFLG